MAEITSIVYGIIDSLEVNHITRTAIAGVFTNQRKSSFNLTALFHEQLFNTIIYGFNPQNKLAEQIKPSTSYLLLFTFIDATYPIISQT